MAARRLPKTTKNDQKPTKNRLPTQNRALQIPGFEVREDFGKNTEKRTLARTSSHSTSTQLHLYPAPPLPSSTSTQLHLYPAAAIKLRNCMIWVMVLRNGELASLAYVSF
jgi:hypothetical protein